jgi:hypothetical protein
MAIDRYSLVHRHNPVRSASNAISPMQVGNGSFAFGADVTGLQTFIPFATMSDWGWKKDPRAIPEEFPGQDTEWLRANPNRLNLARIGLHFGNRKVTESDLVDCHQELDLWTGTIHSSFEYNGSSVEVQTCCHPQKDAISVSIDSPLVAQGELGVFIDFPYCDGRSKFSAPYVGMWDTPDRHSTVLDSGDSQATIDHSIDGTNYNTNVSWNQTGQLKHAKGHRYILDLAGSSSESVLQVSVSFHSTDVEFIDFQETRASSRNHWPEFWQSGGAIELKGSSDPRWHELERRLILAQYVMAVNETGNDPPQESGLVNNGWYGKFHMEMNWWHSAYLALFNRWSLLDKSLTVYRRFFASSLRRAASQGYKGARWPKMTDPSGSMAPGEINTLLIWQQPHPMAFAELDYKAHPTTETLEKWKDILFATADFMASFATWNDETETYHLGPPLHAVSENTDSAVTYNSAFELQYWRFGLSIAQEWRHRLGLSPCDTWAKVADSLAPVAIQDGLYVIWPEIKDMWTKYNWEHPALVGMYGWLPNRELNLEIMKATSHKIWDVWHFDKCWGWDFGMLAMNAARIGEPDKAIDFLLHRAMPFDDVGLSRGGEQVPFPYFPATGSFLYAIAFMAAGWDGSGDDANAPGFPKHGWKVVTEGLSKAL